MDGPGGDGSPWPPPAAAQHAGEKELDCGVRPRGTPQAGHLHRGEEGAAAGQSQQEVGATRHGGGLRPGRVSGRGHPGCLLRFLLETHARFRTVGSEQELDQERNQGY